MVDTARIGVIGVGLGGRLAVLHAAGDGRVKCVVDYFGDVGEVGLKRITRMPPTDIIGLEEDAAMGAMREALVRVNPATEVHVYPGRFGRLAPSDRRDAGQGVERFLGGCLGASGR
jgi:dienelactone hydrolase